MRDEILDYVFALYEVTLLDWKVVALLQDKDPDLKKIKYWVQTNY